MQMLRLDGESGNGVVLSFAADVVRPSLRCRNVSRCDSCSQQSGIPRTSSHARVHAPSVASSCKPADEPHSVPCSFHHGYLSGEFDTTFTTLMTACTRQDSLRWAVWPIQMMRKSNVMACTPRLPSLTALQYDRGTYLRLEGHSCHQVRPRGQARAECQPQRYGN